MSHHSPYKPVRATIESVVTETSNIKTFRLKPDAPFSFLAGQFVELSVPGFGEAPFTPSSSPTEKNWFEMTIMRTGSVTERLHAMKPGEVVAIRGPLGQPYPLDKYKGRDVLIVGGGVGLAPLRALLFGLFEEIDAYKKISVRFGSRSPNDIAFKDAVLQKWNKNIDLVISVDKGDETWKGPTGVVTKILEPDKLTCDPKNGVAVVCGPPIMMKFATFKLLELGYPPENIYLSMEKNMSCGVGKCGHCRIGPYYACKDGPVFTYDKIKGLAKIWD